MNQQLQSDMAEACTEFDYKAAKRAYTANRFGPYRRPTEVTAPKFKAIQEKAQEMALLIEDLCPESQQKQNALDLLEQAKMSANAAIAIHEGEKQ